MTPPNGDCPPKIGFPRSSRAIHGRWTGWLTVATANLLAGAGVFVGRFLRWNSWDLITRPAGQADDGL